MLKPLNNWRQCKCPFKLNFKIKCSKASFLSFRKYGRSDIQNNLQRSKNNVISCWIIPILGTIEPTFKYNEDNALPPCVGKNQLEGFPIKIHLFFFSQNGKVFLIYSVIGRLMETIDFKYFSYEASFMGNPVFYSHWNWCCISRWYAIWWLISSIIIMLCRVNVNRRQIACKTNQITTVLISPPLRVRNVLYLYIFV